MRENAVFFDTTTIVTAATLIDAEHYPTPTTYLRPDTLLDLCTFINGVVLYDRVFHLENKHVDSRRLNEALGNQQVFVTLPVASFESSPGGGSLHSVGAFLQAKWQEAKGYLWMLQEAREGRPHAHYLREEDRNKIATSWQALLPSHVREAEMFKGNIWQDWPNGGRLWLEKLVDDTEGYADAQYLGPGWDGWEEETGKFVQECNLRSTFNFLVAYSIQLPYMPTVARLPFNLFIYEREKVVKDHLGQIEWIDQQYREVANNYIAPGHPNLEMPFFPTVVLNQISSPAEFFDVLAELREKAEPLRARRAELDEALRRGDYEAINELEVAFAQDAVRLPYLSKLTSPRVAAIAAVVPQVASVPATFVLTAIALLAAAKEMHYDDVEQGLRRVFSPTYRVLYNMNQVASELNNAVPAIDKVWGEKSIRKRKIFTEQFDRLKELQYA